MNPIRTKSEEGLWWLGVVGGAGFVLGTTYLLATLDSGGRKDDASMAKPKRKNLLGPVWPIAMSLLQRVGETVMAHRKGSGRPHKGVDLFAPAGSPVLSATLGKVQRIVDGREAPKGSDRYLAGLWVDVKALDGKVYRYLHLASANVREGEPVRPGQQLGTVSRRGDSGNEHSDPHVHFEVRASDWNRETESYGDPLDPLKVLPKRSEVA